MFIAIKNLLLFFKNPIFILIVFNLANVTNLIFQIFVAKNLTLNDFSLFYSCIALISIFLAPFASLQLFIQRNFIRYTSQNNIENLKFFFSFCLKIFFIIQIILLILFIFNLDFLQNKYKYFDNNLFYLFFFLHFFSMLMIIPGGILYSKKKYKLVHSIILIFDIGRLLLLISFINFFDNKLNFLVFINIFYSIACILFMLKIINFNLSEYFIIDYKKFLTSCRLYLKSFFIFMLYSMCLPLIMQIDVIFIRVLFDSNISSSYIVIATLAKAIMIVPHVLQAYIFNESSVEKRAGSYNSIKNYIFYIFISFFVIIFLFFTVDMIILFFYGPNFLLTIDAFIYIAFSFLLISISNILCNIFLVQKKYFFINFFYFSIIIYIILNFINNNSYLDISKNLLLASIIFFIIVIILFSKLEGFKYFKKNLIKK